MRIVLIIALAFPVFLQAQINRSATELARENIQGYVENKLFKNHSYKPVSYSELKENNKPNQEIVWSIQHIFEIMESQTTSDKKIAAPKKYKFLFYLDKKMNVFIAEGSPGLN